MKFWYNYNGETNFETNVEKLKELDPEQYAKDLRKRIKIRVLE